MISIALHEYRAALARSALPLRITFPSLQQNSSPLSILAGYLEVLGRKIDCSEDVQDLVLHYSVPGLCYRSNPSLIDPTASAGEAAAQCGCQSRCVPIVDIYGCHRTHALS